MKIEILKPTCNMDTVRDGRGGIFTWVPQDKIPEWLEDNVTGFLIPPYDLRLMAQKIDYLLEHLDVARAMGLNGRKKWSKNSI